MDILSVLLQKAIVNKYKTMSTSQVEAQVRIAQHM